jgi:hypothetical protein
MGCQHLRTDTASAGNFQDDVGERAADIDADLRAQSCGRRVM